MLTSSPQDVSEMLFPLKRNTRSLSTYLLTVLQRAFFFNIWHSHTLILLITDTNGCKVVSAEFMKERTRMIWETMHLIAARHKRRHSTLLSECLKPCLVTCLGHKTFAIANKRCWTWLDWKKMGNSKTVMSFGAHKATYTSCDRCRKNCLDNTITKQQAGLVTGQLF